MERETRYLVFKITDLHKLSTGMQDVLGVIARDVRAVRAARGKGDLECVVVEKDWPEYDETWWKIAARVDAENGQPNALRSKLDQLERYGTQG